MSLTTRSFPSLVCLACAVAMVIASCGGQPAAPTAPTSVAPVALGADSGSARVTTSDEPGATPGGESGETPGGTPTDTGEPGSPAPAPAPEPPAAGPAPAPGPNPGPAPTPGPVPNPAIDPGPYPAPPPLPGVPNGPILWTPSKHFRLSLKVTPDPVPFSGVPVPISGCRDLPHTWYYEQVLHTETGIPVRVFERENYFDGRLVSRTPVNVEIDGNSGYRINSRWCSAFGAAHTAQHRFKAQDREGLEIVINGPVIQLTANPHYVPPPPRAAGAWSARERAATVFGE